MHLLEGISGAADGIQRFDTVFLFYFLQGLSHTPSVQSQGWRQRLPGIASSVPHPGDVPAAVPLAAWAARVRQLLRGHAATSHSAAPAALPAAW